MDEDSAGGRDLAEQLSLKKKACLQWSVALSIFCLNLLEHVGVASLKGCEMDTLLNVCLCGLEMTYCNLEVSHLNIVAV